MKRRVGLLAMLALNAVPADAAETLGRLFYTPAERAHLDRQQRSAASTAMTSSSALRYSGYVTRAGGPTTLWLDGKSVRDDDPELRARHLRSLADGSVRRAAPGQPPLRLRVGDSVLDGEVVAAYRLERPSVDAEGKSAAPPPVARALRRRTVDARDAGETP